MEMRQIIKKFSNPKEYCCHINAADYEKILPDKLKVYSCLLARIRNKSVRKNELGASCHALSQVLGYEIKDTGYYCEIKCIWKDHAKNENIFWIKNYILCFPDSRAEEMKKEIEKYFFEKYKIAIRFESNQIVTNSSKTSFYYILKKF